MPAGLSIHRLTLDLQAPAGAAERRAGEVARAMHDSLPSALTTMLALPESEAVLLFRSFAIDLTLPAGTPAREIASRLAEAIAAGVRRGIADGRTILRFENPAAYSAAFLTALVEDTAWRRWWFRSFDGVRALPVAAAIRTVLLRDAGQTLEILSAMSPPQRSQVLAALGESEAAHVVQAVLALAPEQLSDAVWSAVLASLNMTDGKTDARATLFLAAAAGTTPAELRAARHVLRVMAFAARSPQSMSRWMVDGAIPADLEREAAHLLAMTPAMVRQLLAERPAVAPLPAEDLFSPFGGYALLCPALLGWPLEAATRDWETEHDPALLRLLLLATATGTARLLDDFAFRKLLGVPPTMTVAEMREWAHRIRRARWSGFAAALDLPSTLPEGAGPPLGLTLPLAAGNALAGGATMLLGGFSRRLPGFATASHAFLHANLLGRGAVFRFLPEMVEVRLERPPLDVLLSITGLATARATLPDGRTLVLARAP